MPACSRRQFLQGSVALAGLGLLSGCGSAAPRAQQPTRVPRIGYLTAGSAEQPPLSVDAFRQALQELGWIEGQNIAIEYRFAGDGVEGFTHQAAELVSLPVDVILAAGTRAALAASEATTTIPIVTSQAGDPVGAGLAASLARPGGNVTGLSQTTRQLAGKRLELLKEAVPGLTRVAVLANPTNPTNLQEWAEMQAVAPALRLELLLVEVRGREDLGALFEAASRGRVEALTTFADPLLNRSMEINDFATASRLPSMHTSRAHVEVGGLMAYGPNVPDLVRRSATYVDKILKGARPADLPIEQPTRFDLIINLKTAHIVGLIIPQSVLLQATELIQ